MKIGVGKLSEKPLNQQTKIVEDDKWPPHILNDTHLKNDKWCILVTE